MIEKEIIDDNDIKYKIKVGKNKFENWNIIDEADQNDIWFHVESNPSPHVVLHMISDNNILKNIPKKIIIECAILCKENSKYKNNQKVSIIYTQIKNIVKGEDVGSVITKKLEKIIV